MLQKTWFLTAGILQVFRGIRAATRGLIAAPWTPASLSLLPGKGVQQAWETDSL
ncbi:MAG TPA: hypothetical protein VGY58_11905 [Gemmataceae bacterium]|nr:hypothetical protein [Gemmataceae bacterium]